jgi:spore coat polysaccharide biosynthesis predicted glycosyltransferase SpsG
VQLVVGGLDPRRTELERRAADLGPGLSLVVDVQNMAPLMTRAHLALSAAGSTVWELAHLGVPALLVVVAENQRGNAEALHRLGVAHNLGDATTLDGEVLESPLDALLEDPDRRTQMSRRGRELVDGRGVERVVAAILGEELVP